jgi:histidine triad (HIT) family protein
VTKKTESGCLFCGIVAGDVPGDVVRRGKRTLAFRDIAPVAPTHVLVVPLDHYRDLAELSGADSDLVAELMADAASVAEAEGLVPDGFRLVLNTGDRAGQTVHHVHVHVLGGRDLTWPPG